MQLACPHCHGASDVPAGQPLADFVCAHCGRSFDLISGDTLRSAPHPSTPDREADPAATLDPVPPAAPGREPASPTHPVKGGLVPTEAIRRHVLRIRCPHCRKTMELADDRALVELTCPSCGGSFGVAGDEALAYETQGGTLRRRTVFGRFELLEELGSGAFGAVWKARDTQLDRIVALKLPRHGQLTADEMEKFFREARAAAQSRHPSIVSVHEVGIQDDTIFIADGGDVVTMSAGVIRTRKPGHWLDPGPLGTLGVGTPFAIAAKAAKPQNEVFVLSAMGRSDLRGLTSIRSFASTWG